VDPSTRRISVGVIDGRDGMVISWDTQSLMQGLHHARLWKAVEALVPFFTGLRNTAPPALVVVEQPFAGGRHVPHESLHMLGVVLATLWGSLGMSAEVMMLSPTVWKSRALGKGRGFAKKPEIMQWAREACGYTGSLEDEADALGIATAGVLALEQRRS
jgi:Holliday junction resolvasome RuvABC endonuclease subunit